MSDRLRIIVFSGVALAFAAGVVHAQAPPFILTSPDFKDGQPMPVKYGDIRLTNGVNTCGPDATKVSPALAWTNTPARAVTLVVTMLDLDAGLGAAHFIAYDIPKDKTSLAAGELLDPKGFAPGMNYRMENYSGPCPPAGAPHHYAINLFATDLPAGTLRSGMTRDQVLAALVGHNVGTATLIGLYQRQ